MPLKNMTAPLDEYMALLAKLRSPALSDPRFQMAADIREQAEAGEHERAAEMRRELERLWDEVEREAESED